MLGQVQGGVAQGLGYALWESLRIDENGKTLEKSFQAYRRPLAIDTPRVETILTEHPTAEGPFGAKGAADPPSLLPPALVACAVSDATGRRIKTIKVGIGAIANRVRHPAVAAMEATTLAGAFPGRFLNLGLGHGLPFWMKQLDLYPKSPLTSMTEAVRGIKRLAKGETLTEKGEYYSFDNIHLAHSAPDLRVMTAVVGPKSVDLTARIADGLQISALAGPRYVREVSERIAKVRAAEGLPLEFKVLTYALASVGPNSSDSRRKMRKAAAFYPGSPWANSAYGSLRRE